jgi:hypothetical protein
VQTTKVLAIVVIMAGCAVGQATKAPEPQKNLAAESRQAGRFQIFFSPHARADVYLLDTETGKIWRPVTITNAQDSNLKTPPEVWLYQDRIDDIQQFNTWTLRHPSTPVPTSNPESQ